MARTPRQFTEGEPLDVAIEDPADEIGDLYVDAEQAKTVVWYVYRERVSGIPLPAGVRAGSRGPFVCKLQGALDVETLARTVGPGIWFVIARQGAQILLSRQIEIDGEPWPLSRFNAPPPLEPAPVVAPAALLPAAPAAPLTLEAVRSEMRALLAESRLAATPAPAAVDPTALFFRAFELARDFNRPATPTDPNAMLGVVVETLKSGIELGRQVNPDAAPSDPLAPLFAAVVPVLERMASRPTVSTPPPALPRGPDGVPVVSAVPVATPVSSPTQAPAPEPARERERQSSETMALHLALGIERNQDPADVADAVSLLLTDDDMASLARASLAELRGWLGSVGLTYPALNSPGADRWLEGFLEAVRNPGTDDADTAAE
jgi:hypothetical protein